MEPASIMRGDNYTMEVLTQTVDNIVVQKSPEHNDEDRKPEGDDMVTPWRRDTLKSCELTDVLTGNTHQATHPGCGGVRGNVIGTHKDTGGPESHSRYRDDRPPERAFNGHKVG